MHIRRVFLTFVARTKDIRGNYRLCFNYLNDDNKILMDLLFWLPKKDWLTDGQKNEMFWQAVNLKCKTPIFMRSQHHLAHFVSLSNT